jgi:nucleoside-diphosphate-sugar epimerase
MTIAGSKILLTGFNGRLAGSLSEALTSAGELWGASLRITPQERSFWEGRGMKLWEGDLGLDDYRGLPSDFDYVIHTAADVYTQDFALGMRSNAEAPGLLMQHVRGAKAFLHVSTCGVYHPHADPWHLFTETDPIGGSPFMGHYTGTKTAGEGTVRTLARLLNMPTIICRLNMQYGTYADGGLPVKHLKAIIEGQPIVLPQKVPFIKAPIHEDDLIRFVEPSLMAARVPAETINWCGDEAFDWREGIEYLAELVGETAHIVLDDSLSRVPVAGDATHRKTITGSCQVSWKEGLRRIVEFWEPRLRNGGNAFEGRDAA